MSEETGKLSIEETFEQLELLIKQLEGDQLTMEQSFEAYAQGLKLIKECRASIDEIEQKVMVLEADGEEHEL